MTIQMQGRSYSVERTFKDGKSQAGLDHYQVRSWRALHHPMALVLTAMLAERLASRQASTAQLRGFRNPAGARPATS